MRKKIAITIIGIFLAAFATIAALYNQDALAKTLIKKHMLSTEEKRALTKAVFEKEGSIYMYDEQTQNISQLGEDTNPKFLPVMSPNKSKIAFAYSGEKNPEYYVKLGILDLKTNKEKAIKVDDYYTNQITYIEWLDDVNVGVEGHINPSTSEFFIYNSNTGELVKKYTGSLFTVLPDRNSILYKGVIPFFSEKQSPDTLYINDMLVYKSNDISANIGYPQISPDVDKIAFIESNQSSENGTLVEADLDMDTKTVKNIKKLVIGNEVHGKLKFDEQDYLRIEDDQTTYKLDEDKKALIKTNTAKDEDYEKMVADKHEKLDSAVKKMFGDNEGFDTVNNLRWSN